MLADLKRLRHVPSLDAEVVAEEGDDDELMRILGSAEVVSEVASSEYGNFPERQKSLRRRALVPLLSVAVALVVLALVATLTRGAALPTTAAPPPLVVADVLRSYAELRAPPNEEELAALERRTQVLINDMSAKDVVATLAAYTKLGRAPQPRLLAALGSRAMKVVGDMDAQDVTSMVSAYAELGGSVQAPSPGMRHVPWPARL